MLGSHSACGGTLSVKENVMNSDTVWRTPREPQYGGYTYTDELTVRNMWLTSGRPVEEFIRAALATTGAVAIAGAKRIPPIDTTISEETKQALAEIDKATVIAP